MDDLSGSPTLKKSGEKPWALAEGATLGGYRVVKPLGKGGMGEVYLVRHEQMGKLYAMKLISPERARDDEFRKRFAVEARVMADLEHPNIVHVHYMGDEGGRFFLVMDHVEGPGGKPQSLADLLAERRKLPEPDARRIVLDVARALEYAHSFRDGVIHRDLKPGNILIDAEARARVSDFGLAKIMGDEYVRSVLAKSVSTSLSAARTAVPGGGLSQSDGAIMGTVEYMAPEQKEGRTDARSDIYALGLVIYRMLTGRQAEGRFALPSKLGCAASWDGIIERALAPVPTDRYVSVPEMIRDIERVSIARTGGGRKVALAVVALGVLAAVGVGGAFIYGEMAKRERLRVEDEDQKAEEYERRAAEAERIRIAEEAKQRAEESKRREEAAKKAALREREAKVASAIETARTFREAGLLDRASEKLVEALAVDPDRAEVTKLLADVRRASAAKKAETEREAEYRKWMEKGFDLEAAGKLVDAARAYDEAAKHAPAGSTEAADAAAACLAEHHRAGAAAAEAKGDLVAARGLYAKALAKREDAATRRALDAVTKRLEAARRRKQAEDAEKAGDLKAALAHYREAARHGGDVSSKVSSLQREITRREEEARKQATYGAAMTKARTLVRQGKWDEAAGALSAVLKANPGNSHATRLLAGIRKHLTAKVTFATPTEYWGIKSIVSNGVSLYACPKTERTAGSGIERVTIATYYPVRSKTLQMDLGMQGIALHLHYKTDRFRRNREFALTLNVEYGHVYEVRTRLIPNKIINRLRLDVFRDGKLLKTYGGN